MTQYDRFYKLCPLICYILYAVFATVPCPSPDLSLIKTQWRHWTHFEPCFVASAHWITDQRSTGPLIAGSIWFNALHMPTKICCAHPAFEPTHPRENSRSWRRLSFFSKPMAYFRSVYFRSLKLREYLSSDVASLSFRWRQRNAWLWLVQGPAVWLLLNVVWMKESLQSALNGLIT